MKNILKTFGPNESGRDFVIGDLHGAYDCFENLLRGINFDEKRDRMFSVGDLVDRGPKPLECLGLLRKNWFHAVLANHEQMMYEGFNGGYMGAYWFMNGGGWGMSAWNVAEAIKKRESGLLDPQNMPIITDDDFELLDLLPLVEELPYLITINHKSGKKFHIIHAELPPGHQITDDTLSSPGKVEELATIQTQNGGDTMCWGRYLFMPFYDRDLNNRNKVLRIIKRGHAMGMFNDKLSHIISGHTILKRPLTILAQTNIDTEAYGSYPEKRGSQYGVAGYERPAPQWKGLTCVNLDDWTFVNATPTQFREVEPMVVNRQDLLDLSEDEEPKDE